MLDGRPMVRGRSVLSHKRPKGKETQWNDGKADEGRIIPLIDVVDGFFRAIGA